MKKNKENFLIKNILKNSVSSYKSGLSYKKAIHLFIISSFLFSLSGFFCDSLHLTGLFCDSLFLSGAHAYSVNDGQLTADVEKGMMFLSLDGEGNLDELVTKNRKYDFMPVEPGESTMQTLKARLKGNITDNLKIDWDYDSTSWPSNKKFQLGYEKKNTRLKLGDLALGFSGLDFSMTRRTLFGFQAKHDTKNDRFLFCAAKLKTSFESENMVGDDTTGPFFLSNYPIEDMSERILIDDEIRIQNIHYTIDYKTGVVKFNDPVEKGRRIRIDYEHTDLFDSIDSYVGAARYKKVFSPETGAYKGLLKGVSKNSSIGTFVTFQNKKTGLNDSDTEIGMLSDASVEHELSRDEKDMVLGFDFKTGYGKFRISGEVAVSNDTSDDESEARAANTVTGLSKITDSTNISNDDSMTDMTGRAVKINASYRDRGFTSKAVLKHINKDFGIVGSNDYDNNRNYYKFDTSYIGIRDVKLNSSFMSEKRNIEKVLDQTPEKSEAKAGISYKMPFRGRPLVSYNVRLNEERIETDSASASEYADVKISEKDELTHSIDMKYRIKKVLFKTGVDYKQKRYDETFQKVESASFTDFDTQTFFDTQTEDTNDLQARFEVKARVARPVVGTFRINLTDHDGLEGDTGKTKEGIIDLDTKISENLTLTTGIRVKESDFILDSKDYARSLRLIGKRGSKLTARLSYEGRAQKSISKSDTNINETTVMSGDLEYSFRPGISLRGELIERRQKGSTDGNTASETEAGLVLNYKINKNFDLSAHVKKMIQSGMDTSDYDGTIRYFKATGRF